MIIAGGAAVLASTATHLLDGRFGGHGQSLGAALIAAGLALGLATLLAFAFTRTGRPKGQDRRGPAGHRRDPAGHRRGAAKSQPPGHAQTPSGAPPRDSRPPARGGAGPRRDQVLNPATVYSPGGLLDGPPDAPAAESAGPAGSAGPSAPLRARMPTRLRARVPTRLRARVPTRLRARAPTEQAGHLVAGAALTGRRTAPHRRPGTSAERLGRPGLLTGRVLAGDLLGRLVLRPSRPDSPGGPSRARPSRRGTPIRLTTRARRASPCARAPGYRPSTPSTLAPRRQDRPGRRRLGRRGPGRGRTGRYRVAGAADRRAVPTTGCPPGDRHLRGRQGGEGRASQEPRPPRDSAVPRARRTLHGSRATRGPRRTRGSERPADP